jgi:hypothetical protein
MTQVLRVLSSTGNLGDTVIQKGTFYEGLKRPLDFLAADAGTADCGPAFLGGDVAHNPREWEKHDLELLLVASREKGIPLIIGSCSTSGTKRGVDLYAELVAEIAGEKKLPPFKLATIYSDIDKGMLKERIRSEPVEGLGFDFPLTEEIVDRTTHVTAMMGVEPIIEALRRGADVVLAGRCCDDAVYAAYPISQGFPKGVSLHLGKAIECASLVCWPQKVKESVLGTVREGDFSLEPIHPDQRATVHSVAAHSMYERVDPYVQAVPGGILDMHESVFEQTTDRVTTVCGSRFIPSPDATYKVKLEGAGVAGSRVFHFVGIRDPLAIRQIDGILKDVKREVAEIMASGSSSAEYDLHLHVFGKNGVMGELEPIREIRGHELGILIEVVSDDVETATAVAKAAKFRFFYLSYPGQKNASGGAASIVIDEPLFPKNQAFRWTMDHLLRLDDPLEVFPITIKDISGTDP